MIRLIDKYSPTNIDDLNINYYDNKLLKTLISTDDINILINGNTGTGKTSLINIIISEYYNFKEQDINTINNIKDKNILYINILNDHGINYYRNEVNNFCLAKSIIKSRKKFIIIDSIDIISEQNQYIFKNYIEYYLNNINFIISSVDLSKVYEPIINKLFLIRVQDSDYKFLKKIYNNINSIERFDNDNLFIDNVINTSNNSISDLINIVQKIILNNNILVSECKTSHKFDELFTLCKNRDVESSYKILLDMYNLGISIYDILDRLNNYIKICDSIDSNIKYKIYKIIITYINHSYNLHNDKVQLLFLINNIIRVITI